MDDHTVVGTTVSATLDPCAFGASAMMIRPMSDSGVGGAAPFVSREFTLNQVAGTEVLCITAHGLYRAFINGHRVGEDELTPGWTVYDKRLSYQSYSVSDLLVVGVNHIEIWLGDGWFRSQLMLKENPLFNVWGSHVAVLAALSRGDEALLATDEQWRSGSLPILRNGIYLGETYDARLENLVADQGVTLLPFDRSVLVAAETTAVRRLAPLRVQSRWIDEQGRETFDFGQNVGGYVAFEVEGAAGSMVTVEHAEILSLDRSIDNRNYRTAPAKLTYILKGDGLESYCPSFTFMGFRYARVTIQGAATLRSIVSIPISSVTEPRGWVTTGHPLINRLVENTKWSQRGNFIDIPTDCPQRDERLGWTGDAQVFAATACYLEDVHAFFVKWLRDVMADQREGGEIPHVVPDPTRHRPDKYPGFYGSTGWGDAIVIVPWTLWLHYGDRAIVVETLPAMARWVDFVWSISDGPIVRPPRTWGARGFTFGDWLQPSGPSEKPLPTIGDDAAATIYLFISSQLVAKMAMLVGDDALAARMAARAELVKAAFAREFITASGRLAYDDQTSYALAILHDLIPADHLDAAGDYFRSTIARAEGKIGTGFIGTPALLPALIKIGAVDLAADVLLQEDVPGWLYQVKMGATTIWERWDAIRADGTAFDPAMNSYNHYAYGAVCQWFFEALAGFRPDPDAPAFQHIVFEPVVIARLSPVSASHNSQQGAVHAAWHVEGRRVTYTMEVPAGATATLVLGSRYSAVVVDGAAVTGSAPYSIALTEGHHTAAFDLAG